MPHVCIFNWYAVIAYAERVREYAMLEYENLNE